MYLRMLLTMHVRSYSVKLGMMGSYLCIRMDYVLMKLNYYLKFLSFEDH